MHHLIAIFVSTLKEKGLKDIWNDMLESDHEIEENLTSRGQPGLRLRPYDLESTVLIRIKR